MSIPLFHDRQIDVASMMAPETFLFTISKKKLIFVGGRSYPQLSTAKVAASMVVITGSAQRDVLIALEQHADKRKQHYESCVCDTSCDQKG